MSGNSGGRLTLLDEHHIDFPDTENALLDPNGLLAIGGQLTPEWLLAAYRRGIFPWFSEDQPILWWSPSPRCVIFPAQYRIGRSLRKTLRKGDFAVTFDRAFSRVVDACRAPRAYTDETWITDEMGSAYAALHRLGHAHSVEVWQKGELVGGLYGVAIGRMFFGESMFHRVTDASKVAFAYLVRQLDLWGCPMIDCQVSNPHLTSLGAVEVARATFERQLKSAIAMPPFPEPWSVTWNHE
ncbi:leucyl/phenylalanyl-tRNA--protein transferase [Microbulbifer flavimaris]|uniref:Leucyl/phenylalanyl-tRNA--protein transferase n=1 Tax=Microbulbifer flavimaris TaxID=1781068 RepID=A0ABX4I3A5_9GAMM|nr:MULTISPECIES: leucyl/phenylalanyl-tRNA--protein transferase [Microbulbifer]KUJ84732.1 leucyl/phenylalanyl-tRNA--protein transferase [Microbulbifer sp. ZGT114]PCO06826.1 leucyl/phenylalanyl-tRNA--protein transferase [Microbulbifer flavimaris]